MLLSASQCATICTEDRSASEVHRLASEVHSWQFVYIVNTGTEQTFFSFFLGVSLDVKCIRKRGLN